MKADPCRKLRIGMEATHGLVSCKTRLAPGRASIWGYDKWCAMMWPRLRLLLELLSDGGTLFVCIDDIEANLGSRSHVTPDSRTLSADAKRSESPRWR